MAVFALLLFLVYCLGLTMWMVNGSSTANSSDSISREAKQMLLPLQYPGQYADFNDYMIPSFQPTEFAIHTDQVNKYNNPALNVYPESYEYYPLYGVPAALVNGRMGLSEMATLIKSLLSSLKSKSISNSASARVSREAFTRTRIHVSRISA